MFLVRSLFVFALVIVCVVASDSFDETLEDKVHGKFGLLLSPILQDCKKERLGNIMDFTRMPHNIDDYPRLIHVELSSDVNAHAKLYFFATEEERTKFTISGSDLSEEELLEILKQQIKDAENGVVPEPKEFVDVEESSVAEIHDILKENGVIRVQE